MTNESTVDTHLKGNTFPRLLLVAGLLALIISIFQLTNSDIKYGFLSLCYTSVFLSVFFHNRILRDVKNEIPSKELNKIFYSTIIVGIFIGISTAYLILEIIV